MGQVTNNSGVVNFGGNTNISGSAVGDGATVYVGRPAPKRGRPAAEDRRAVGIVTVLAAEASAVIETLDLSEVRAADGHRFYTGGSRTTERTRPVVAVRAIGPGQRSVMAALGSLRQEYDPAVLALVGIGGGVHRDVATGDVVVATRVIYYDLRKVVRGRVSHRGEEHRAPASVTHAVNSFFTDRGEPAELSVATNTFRVHGGPIGSGEAVIADDEHEIRKYLAAYNDKILAVDMEAGGLSQFCYEAPSESGAGAGWVVIRGISDHADSAKNDAAHQVAAANAAHTLRELIPYLTASQA
jgi:adenosylhomocysteine nucleosidase